MLGARTERIFQDNITLLLTAFISGILSPIVLHWARYFFNKKEKSKQDDILQYLHFNEQIDDRLEQLRSEYNLDRVWLAQFHNGGSFYPTGVHQKFQKFSVTFESCKSGISSEHNQITNVPVSLFAGVFKKLAENSYYGIPNVDESSENVKSFWADRNIKGFHMFAVRCLEKKFVGILCIDYVGRSSDLTQKAIESFLVEARVLGGYLTHVEP